jgi:hypothetical protein
VDRADYIFGGWIDGFEGLAFYTFYEFVVDETGSSALVNRLSDAV